MWSPRSLHPLRVPRPRCVPLLGTGCLPRLSIEHTGCTCHQRTVRNATVRVISPHHTSMQTLCSTRRSNVHCVHNRCHKEASLSQGMPLVRHAIVRPLHQPILVCDVRVSGVMHHAVHHSRRGASRSHRHGQLPLRCRTRIDHASGAHEQWWHGGCVVNVNDERPGCGVACQRGNGTQVKTAPHTALAQ